MDDAGYAFNGATAYTQVAERAFHKLKTAFQIGDVFAEAGGEIVNTDNVSAIGEQSPENMPAYETGAAGD